MNKTSFINTNLNEISTISNLKINYLLAANSHFYTVLISCLHQCFANLNFCRNSQIKWHFHFCAIYTLTFLFVFTTVSVKTWFFEVALKSSLNCRYHSCRYAHCIYILLIIIQLARPLDLYSSDILWLIRQFCFMSNWVCDALVIGFTCSLIDLLDHWFHKNTLVLWLNSWCESFYTMHVT